MRSRSLHLSQRTALVVVVVLELGACRSLIGYEDSEVMPVADAAAAPSTGADASPAEGQRDAAARDASNDADDSGITDASAADAADAAPFICTIDASAKASARSCSGIPTTCGPNRDGGCCDSVVLDGGSYDRYGDGRYAATVNTFSLDTYEVTVGRFRKFAEAYVPDPIPACAGKNPSNPDDPGWQAAWGAKLPADKGALYQSLACSPAATWVDSRDAGDLNENRPINCVTWWLAEAFCIWDNGRLPTDTEWVYAAIGGSENRKYPWGNTEPGLNADLAVYDCWFDPTAGQGCNLLDIARVGVPELGNARWGHANMAGNVSEWVQDLYGSAENATCDNCARLTSKYTTRIIRGGDWVLGADPLRGRALGQHDPSGRFREIGFRCARNP